MLIGSPDHWHVPMTVDACDAGKDVYVEKPLTHDPSEAKTVVDAQNRHKRVVQVRHATAEHAALPEGTRTAEGRSDRPRAEGPHDVEPQRPRADPHADGRRPERGRLEGVSGQRGGSAVRRVPVPQLAAGSGTSAGVF
ncbi:MAG: Gfo/Idh/MocA family oxidoreductase [Isosphaeraceae bacterium]